jgi:hypothetical protein
LVDKLTGKYLFVEDYFRYEKKRKKSKIKNLVHKNIMWCLLIHQTF